MGQYPLGPPKNLESERFTLLDPKGRVRAELTVFSGMPVLQLYDEDGKIIWKAP